MHRKYRKLVSAGLVLAMATGTERYALNRICAKAKLARLHVPGKDGFRAPAHGIPGVMRVSPCRTRR